MLIEGTHEFCERTKHALELIDENREGLPRQFIKRIKQAKFSGMDVSANPPTFLVGDSENSPWRGTLSWYASCIVHDANHAREHKKRLVQNKGVDVDQSELELADEERRCMVVQEKFLRKIQSRADMTYARQLGEKPVWQLMGSDVKGRERNW